MYSRDKKNNMKYIFDFDDVIFHTTRHRKEHMFVLLEKAGIPLEKIEAYYKVARVNLFSLKKILEHFSVPPNLYGEIMNESKSYINKDIFEFIKKIDKKDKYIVTYGDAEFNKEKLIYSGAFELFNEQNIFIVQGSKKEIVESICTKHKDEEVIFIDDKEKEFADLDLQKYPNLKTVLYTGQLW